MSIIQNNIERLLAERKAAWERDGKPIADAAATRELSTDETRAFESASAEFESYTQRINALEPSLEQDRAVAQFAEAFGNSDAERARRESETWRNLATGERAALRNGESITEHPTFERVQRSQRGDVAIANYDNLGALVRSLASGTGGGSAIVPVAWGGQLIDLARQASAVGRAGATIVPMDAKELTIGRKTANPSAAFRAENPGSALTPGEPTFDSVTLSAKTSQALVVGSIEWFQDAPNAEQLIVQALAEAIADQIDLVALYGGITTGAGSISLATPPNPRGVLADLTANKPANVLGTSATNGTTPTVAGGYWNEVLDAVFTLIEGNEQPTAILRSGKLARQYAKAVDTTGQPLRVPEALAGIDQITVNPIPTYTKGTLTTATDLFVADWKQLLIGQRLDITLQPLPELFAAEGKRGVLATWRGDIQLARQSAFSVYRALAGA